MVDPNPRAVMGGNAPPDPLLTEAAERVETANRYLTERANIEQWDEATADKANFFVSQVDATFKALDGRRLEEGRQFKAQQDAVYAKPLDLLTRAKSSLVDLRRKWLKKEEDRLAEEKRKAAEAAEAARKVAEEARLKAEAEARKKRGNVLEAQRAAGEAAAHAAAAQEAAAAAPEKAKITGTYSPRATGLRDYWMAEITDLTAAFEHYNAKNNPNRSVLSTAITEAIQRIADAEAKRVKDENAAPPGIKFKKDRR